MMPEQPMSCGDLNTATLTASFRWDLLTVAAGWQSDVHTTTCDAGHDTVSWVADRSCGAAVVAIHATTWDYPDPDATVGLELLTVDVHVDPHHAHLPAVAAVPQQLEALGFVILPGSIDTTDETPAAPPLLSVYADEADYALAAVLAAVNTAHHAAVAS